VSFLQRLAAFLDPAGTSRGSLEDPGVPLSSPNILSYLGVNPVESGVEVTSTTAMRLACVFACLRVRAEALAALPWGVYRRRGGSRVEVDGHPLGALLRDMTKREALSMHVDGWGNGYLERVDSSSGELLELDMLSPDLTGARKTAAGRLYYVTWTEDLGSERAIPADSVVHVAGPGWDGVTGYSLLAMHAESIGYGIAARDTGARLMRNDGRPRGVIEVAHRLQVGAGEGIRDEFEAAQAGANQGRIAVLGAGSKYQNISLPPDQLQYIEQMNLALLDVARIFLTPPHKIGFLRDAGDRANIEHENLRFATDVLVPASRRLELAVDAKCFSESERRAGFFTKIDLRGMLRGDYKSRMEGYRIGREMGLYNADEIRALEDDGPIGGRAGETYLVPLNLVDAAEEPKEPEPIPAALVPGTEPKEPDPERFRPLFVDAARRLLHREAEELAAIGGHVGRYGVAERTAERFRRLWVGQHRRHRETFTPLLEAIGDGYVIGRSDTYVRRHAELAERVIREHRGNARATGEALAALAVGLVDEYAEPLAELELEGKQWKTSDE